MSKGVLAINGGTPLLKKNEGRYVHPFISKKIETAVISQLHDSISIYDDSGIFEEFEKAFASYHNKKYGLVVSSGTAALWSMYEGIGLSSSDEILCPAYTFFATNTPIFFTGATPIFVDCNEFGNINVDAIESKITPRTKAIVVTHMWGYACEMDVLRSICDRYGLFLLEDCSHAHGGSYKGLKLGEWGDAAVFSLQGNKIITGGEGGILITNNRSIYERAVFLGHYNKRCKQVIDPSDSLFDYSVTGKGMKLRAHPIAIRIAHEQFKEIDDINNRKQLTAKSIIDGLSTVEGLNVLEPIHGSKNSWYALIIKYDSSAMRGVSRELFVRAMQAEGATEVDIPSSTCPVTALPLFRHPCLIFPEYQESHYRLETYPNAELFYKTIIKIPVWENIDDWKIVKKYIAAFQKVASHIDELPPCSKGDMYE